MKAPDRFSAIAAAAWAAVLACPLLAAWAAENLDQARREKEQKYIAVLQSDAPAAEKAITCKHLARCGGKDAVPALAPLLSDPQLASWARIALEAIPDPAASQALREAAGTLNGRLLIGVIHSLGVRRDPQAVSLLVARLEDADPEVASAAAVTLGRIGGPKATQALSTALGTARPPVRSAVAEGCILCAERAWKEGRLAEAQALYDQVRSAQVPKQRILEGTRGAILVRQSAGAPLLAELLRSPDRDHFALGLRVAREMSAPEASEVLLAAANRAPAERQVLLILALADRHDPRSLGPLMKMVAVGAREVRLAALEGLRQAATAHALPTLLAAAADADPQVAQTALDVLSDLALPELDTLLVTELQRAQGNTRQVLIQLVGRRNIAAAVPAVLQAASDPDKAVRLSALTALGNCAQFADLPVLVRRVAEPPADAEEAKAAFEALRIACQRMPDREACAEQLAAALQGASVPARCRLLEVLADVGGTRALQAVAAAATQNVPELQDTATRLLGEWMSLDAAPVLAELARSAKDERFQVRAVRGYIRLARQFDMAEPQRLAMCRTALDLARRDVDKKLVFEVLQRYPSVEGLRLAVEAGKAAALKDDAAEAALAIAQKLGARGPEVQALLIQLGRQPIRLEILRAEYGAQGKYVDVTAILRHHARDLPLVLLPSESYNASFGGDPVPGVVKELRVEYRINGKPGKTTFRENATILLPMPE